MSSVGAPEQWFSGGDRLAYDPGYRTIGVGPLRVFSRGEGNLHEAVTFLPGFPDGSFGWSHIHPFLPPDMPKLFFDYVGMGDSDKPRDYSYSTDERTDLVEALWRHLEVRSTTLVAFDFSSLVVLDHLRRRLERANRGDPPGGPEISGVLIFNGGLFTDGHSHPWFTTPVLRRLPRRAWKGLGRSLAMFKLTAGAMWSKGYRVGDAEIADLLDVLRRHDGAFYLAAAAGFAADHRAQGKRLDFGEIFAAYRGTIPFLVGGSEEDPFEHRQIALARKRLGKSELQIRTLPGGHLATSEQPQALADLITSFERSARESAGRSR
jgi:pimeloyl-ACP methyl ester carboxylesterase